MGIIGKIIGRPQIGSNIDLAMDEVSAGRMAIITDSRDHGYLFVSAEHANAAAINFMATNARGIVCLALTQQRADLLGLELQPSHAAEGTRPRFTVSIEARTGVSTGISAHDRARTIAVATDRRSRGHDLVSPGHVFPMVAADLGSAPRFGHCEAGVALAELAGFAPAGVMCAILDENGAMASLSDLVELASTHGLTLAAAQAIATRHRRHRRMEAVRSSIKAHVWPQWGSTAPTLANAA